MITWDRSRAVLVVPSWPTYYWHSQLLRMAMKKLLYFRQTYGLPKNQTDGNKGNSTANMVLEGTFLGSTHSKYVGYIKK